MPAARFAVIDALVKKWPDTINGDYMRELLQALKAERAIVGRMQQLVGEMQESECGPFPDSPSNEGWCRARNFYSREIQAIIRQAK
jgi:hypothetical protein